MIKEIKNIKQHKSTSKTMHITAENTSTMALSDLKEGLKHYESWLRFAIHDIRLRFRRSTFGPFWLTISTGAMIASIGFIFSRVFNQDISTFIPRMAINLIFWNFLKLVVEDSSKAFIDQRSYIYNIPTPLSVHLYRMYTRSFFIWLHDIIIYLFIFFIYIKNFSIENLLFFPGLLLFVANLFWAGLVIAVVSTRFRDIPQILNNLLQIFFLITPIIWNIEVMEAKDRIAFINWNPFYHVLEVVCSPLLGSMPSSTSWFVSISIASVGTIVAIKLFRRAYVRIPYWI